MGNVIYTGHVPQCPHCRKPTNRTGGTRSTTCMYYPPHYNEKGENTNPDRNTTTSSWNCEECNKPFTISGNNVDGFNYKN